ncbi:DEAD/DEAH box helicase [Candidatus Woesearchaeota archaeon]|nr:DEAD/DEAH box helicase [Candidatus Woesearchaeota archaeon]
MKHANQTRDKDKSIETSVESFKHLIPETIFSHIANQFKHFRPGQAKAIKAGLFKNKNLLVCTPTASGKTLIAEMAFLQAIKNYNKKVVYAVPLRALANDKFQEFKAKYPELKIAISTGDFDSDDKFLAMYDLIITTSEKLDSLLRHKAAWIKQVKLLIIDEIHLLNDISRGPTLEFVITLLRKLIPNLQIIALSATIGNPEELASWLNAELVIDDWRPVKLYQGIYLDGEVEFY